MERGYSVSIYGASKELSKVEKIRFKSTENCVRLDEATKEGKVVITPEAYVILDVHNEKANGDKDYRQYLIIDSDGTAYLTGSNNLFDTFLDIFNEMDGEAFQIEILRKPSKNFKGKDFLTCSLI